MTPGKQFEAALEFARQDDTLMVTKLDRFACSVVHLGKIIETLVYCRLGRQIGGKLKRHGKRLFRLNANATSASWGWNRTLEAGPPIRARNPTTE